MQTAALCSLPVYPREIQIASGGRSCPHLLPQQEYTLTWRVSRAWPYLVVAFWVQAVIVLSVLVGAMDVATVLTP